MTVYVDDMRAHYGRLVLCHMAADTEPELHAMADAIGIARRWFQGYHYDICVAKRALAVQRGAQEVSRVELGRLVLVQRRAARGLSKQPSKSPESQLDGRVTGPREDRKPSDPRSETG